MTNDIKKGSIVRCINAYSQFDGLLANELYVVDDIYETDLGDIFLGIKGFPYVRFSIHRFELYPQPKPEAKFKIVYIHEEYFVHQNCGNVWPYLERFRTLQEAEDFIKNIVNNAPIYYDAKGNKL